MSRHDTFTALESLPHRQLSCDHLDVYQHCGSYLQCSHTSPLAICLVKCFGQTKCHHVCCWRLKILAFFDFWLFRTTLFGFALKGCYSFCICSWLDHLVLGQINVTFSRLVPNLPPVDGHASCSYSRVRVSAWLRISVCMVLSQETQEIGHCCSKGPRNCPSSCLSSCCMARADLNQKVFVCRQAVTGMLATIILVPCAGNQAAMPSYTCCW